MLLESTNNKPNTSYIWDIWSENYLKDRRPVVITHNPFLVFPLDKNPAKRTQLIKATEVVWATAKVYLTMRDGHLRPEVFYATNQMKKKPNLDKIVKYLPNRRISSKKYKIDNQSIRYLPYAMNNAYPLDMTQFKNLFHSTRIPRPEMDEIKLASTPQRHLVVLHKGKIFSVNAFDEDWNVRKEEEIMGDLAAILQEGRNRQTIDSVCSLTSLDRDTWSDARQHLIKTGNAESLRRIDEALFCLVLCDTNPESSLEQSNAFLTGDARSRWHDKSFSMVITANSNMALTYEHAWGDGVPNLRYLETIGAEIKNKSRVGPDMEYKPGNLDEIKFSLDGKSMEDIKKARQFNELQKKDLLVDSLPAGNAPIFESSDFFTPEFIEENRALGIGREWFKNNRIGSDGFIQLSYQIAFRLIRNDPVSVYESCGTAAFKHGRTETIRPVTKESDDLILAYIKNLQNFDDRTVQKEINEKLRVAIRKHNAITKECLQGHGFDRHFFALKDQAIKNGLPMPELFLDRNDEILNDFIVSTSTLNTQYIQFGGFAPKPNCYGIGYMVFDDWLGCCIAGYKDVSCPFEINRAINEVWKNLKKCIIGSV